MQFVQLKRREFITLLGGAAAWPMAARAQQGERMRRIGVLTTLTLDSPEMKARLATFLQALQQLGWTDGRNLRLDYRSGGASDAERLRRDVTELVALLPDVILATGASALAALLEVTRSVPIVFTQVSDPVGAGHVASLARPGGNATGFALFEYGMSGKWLELLKQIAPDVTRAVVLRDPRTTTGIGQLAALHSAAPALGVELSPVGLRDPGEIERGVAAFARSGNGGMILTAGNWGIEHRDLIIALAARHRLPAVYPYRLHVAAGGLMSYATDSTEPFRRAAGYIDRILKGEKPADLPVQAPTKYELVINLKTAKALGLEVPATVLVRADEVIE
jgi:putative ABC transport system substrate-binding protein